MKKFMVALMAVLFLGSTGMVFAQAPDASTTPVVKAEKAKKHKKAKKAKKVAAAPAAVAPAAASTTPAAK
jgi:hypothetical protein